MSFVKADPAPLEVAGLRWMGDVELFGPAPIRTVAAYHELAPLADGWRERIALWQLFPLLVHAVLFGGGYIDRSRALARRLSS